MYTIGQFAKKIGVTIRTLHYYDEIGLLPAIVENNGRRFYTNEQMTRLKIGEELFDASTDSTTLDTY